MTPFRLELKAGLPIYEQVLYAARKAIISGELSAGEPFPSVRALAQEYRINPNTVQKALNALKSEGLVEILPGVGARVCEAPSSTRQQRAVVLGADLEALVLRAKQLGISQSEITTALARHWDAL
jgi:GntR family transcriptional regulator